MALPDATDGVQPTNERLTLPGGSAARLRRPGTFVDQFDGYPPKLLAQLFAFRLQDFEGDAGPAIQFIV